MAADGRYLPTCGDCLVRACGACPGYGIKAEAGPSKVSWCSVPSRVQVIPARRPILHSRYESDDVPVICSGWAASSIATPNGRKHIVAFALAGEIASTNYLFESCAGRALEAVSEVSCRKFRRTDLHKMLTRTPAFAAKLGQALADERERADQASLDLGRRSAEARLARLIFSLYDRLCKKVKSSEGSCEFPLRQQQLADATGLTAVHVCKILSRFRASGLLEIEDRTLRIRDERRLRELAEWG